MCINNDADANKFSNTTWDKCIKMLKQIINNFGYTIGPQKKLKA